MSLLAAIAVVAGAGALAGSWDPLGTDEGAVRLRWLLLGAFLLALVVGLVVAWLEQSSREPMDGEALRAALAGGREIDVEQVLRKTAAASDPLRGWVGRCQLVELLLAEGRYAEARAALEAAADPVPEVIRTHVAFTRAEVAALSRTADESLLNELVSERHTALQGLGGVHREEMERAWSGLQGLCLSRMGRVDEAVPLLSSSLSLVRHRPTAVVFLYHLAECLERSGELDRAREHYDYARKEFPGSSFGSHAHERLREIEH